MSKSIGNVVSPEEIQQRYGSDTARLFILFAAPPEKELDWSDSGVEGSYRFLNRVYRLVYDYIENIRGEIVPDSRIEIRNERDKSLNYTLNGTIKKVTEDAGGRYSFNTAISSIMELVNELYKYKQSGEINVPLMELAINDLLLILNPFTPHITEELWSDMGHKERVYQTPWPEYDPSALVLDEIEVIVQINGRIKDKLVVPRDTDKEKLEGLARSSAKVQSACEGKTIVKAIVIPGKLVNFVAK